MPDLRELYQEVILDHTKKPRNFRRLEGASHQAIGHNPLCGDKVAVFVKLEGDVVQDVTFQGQGCAVSTASASMLTESIKGKSRSEVEALFERFHDLVTGAAGSGEGEPELGKLAIFAGVQKYPVRVKCATLPWHTLRAALERKAEAVSTE
jgi:nitrogen fixation NifU-like protein